MGVHIQSHTGSEYGASGGSRILGGGGGRGGSRRGSLGGAHTLVGGGGHSDVGPSSSINFVKPIFLEV